LLARDDAQVRHKVMGDEVCVGTSWG
jgi:hypothetical protein